MADTVRPLTGVTPDSMADEVGALGKTFRFENAAAGLTEIPLLALTADDGLAPDTMRSSVPFGLRAATNSQLCTLRPITVGQTTASLSRASFLLGWPVYTNAQWRNGCRPPQLKCLLSQSLPQTLQPSEFVIFAL